MGIKNIEKKVEKLEKHEQASSSPRVLSTLADYVAWAERYKRTGIREDVEFAPWLEEWLLSVFQESESNQKKKHRGRKPRQEKV